MWLAISESAWHIKSTHIIQFCDLNTIASLYFVSNFYDKSIHTGRLPFRNSLIFIKILRCYYLHMRRNCMKTTDTFFIVFTFCV